MMISVKFNGVDMYDEYGLILSSKSISSPEPQFSYVEVPFRDGAIDMTEAVSGTVKYKDRNISLTFIYLGNDLEQRASEVYTYIHGKKMEIIFGDDPDFYYVGRINSDKTELSTKASKYTVNIIAEPYKYDVHSSSTDWEWDSFNFNTGIINDLTEITVDTVGVDVTLVCRRAMEIPTFTATEAMEMDYEGETYKIKKGESKLYDVFFAEGINTMTFRIDTSGREYEETGSLSIDYKGGVL